MVREKLRMKSRTPIPRISPKRKASLGNKPIFSTISVTKKRLKKKARKPSETLRIYGPPARRVFVKSLPCAACRYDGKPSEQAHVLGNGGMGRKKDANTIAPLCAPHVIVDTASWSMHDYIGCHRLFDRYRSVFDERFPDFDPTRAAHETEEKWRLYEAGA